MDEKMGTQIDDTRKEKGRAMLSRRAFVGKLAAGAAGAAVVSVAGVATAKVVSGKDSLVTDRNPGQGEGGPDTGVFDPNAYVVDAGPAETATAPAPWQLISPLMQGSVVVAGWQLTDFTGVSDGACVITLQNSKGRAQRIHLCRNDGSPQGLIHTKRLDLVVMNGGQGELATDEGFAQAVAQLAHVLAKNEDFQSTAISALLPHAERVRLFSGADDRRLR